MPRKTMLNAAILLAIACTPPAAYAEDAVAQTDQGDTEATPSWTLKPVEVTARSGRYTTSTNVAATRTDTPLIEVPRSVQVITSTLLQEQDRRTLGEALVNVSGVTPTRSDENLFIPPIVRGFPAEVYLDGLPLFAGNQQAYDPTGMVGISSISVLKGPSAALYGGGLGTPLGASSTSRASDQTPRRLAAMWPYAQAVFLRPIPMPTSMCRFPHYRRQDQRRIPEERQLDR